MQNSKRSPVPGLEWVTPLPTARLSFVLVGQKGSGERASLACPPQAALYHHAFLGSCRRTAGADSQCPGGLLEARPSQHPGMQLPRGWQLLLGHSPPSPACASPSGPPQDSPALKPCRGWRQHRRWNKMAFKLRVR